MSTELEVRKLKDETPKVSYCCKLTLSRGVLDFPGYLDSIVVNGLSGFFLIKVYRTLIPLIEIRVEYFSFTLHYYFDLMSPGVTGKQGGSPTRV